jgi:membrane-bound serine protease (ClpP class)
MDVLINPNVAYLLAVLSVLAILAAMVTPGTGVIELGALLLFGATAYMISRLGMNPWALVVLVLSVIPFFLALRNKHSVIYLIISIVMLIGGSIFIFIGPNGRPLVDPIIAVIVSILSGSFIWIAATKSIQAQQAKKFHNPDDIVGKTGEARTSILKEGSVQIDSELWSARSELPISAGEPVRVMGRDGFILIVEKANNPQQ